MEFNTPYKIINHSIPVVDDSGESFIETAGYIDAKTQIENMIFAGRRLDESREELFDFSGDYEFDEDYPINPARKKGMDLAEASEINEGLMSKFLHWKRAKMDEKVEESKKKDDEENLPKED